MEEINELQEQVRILEDRVYVLERKEATRKVLHGIKLLIYILIIGGIIFGGFYGYNYVKSELPKIIENKVKETGNNIKDKISDTIKGNN